VACTANIPSCETEQVPPFQSLDIDVLKMFFVYIHLVFLSSSLESSYVPPAGCWPGRS